MNILYCGDINSQRGLLISILSLLKNTNEDLQIYVLTARMPTQTGHTKPIPKHTINFLNQLVQQQNPQSKVQGIDITANVEAMSPRANLATIFTPACMLRLYADQLAVLPDKLLYLDTDVICRQNFTTFYHQDLSHYEIGGVLDHYGQWFFHQHWPYPDYLNSGVLLLNLPTIRQSHLFARCLIQCQQQKMFMPDQSALNQLAKHKKILPRKFNEQRRLHQNTVFQHFTTSFRMFPWVHTLTVKPWEISQMHQKLKIHVYDDLLAEYQQLLPNLTMDGDYNEQAK